MKNTYQILNTVPLFATIPEHDIESLLKCLDAQVVSFGKNQIIYNEEERVTKVGIILEGKVRIAKDDLWGNRFILATLEPGDMFGEAFACAGAERTNVNVTASEPCVVLMLDFKRIVTSCTSACMFHSQLIKNMMMVLGKKNIHLTQKMEHITKRTTKEKLLSYLSSESKKQGTTYFDIPYNRQELADYLSVDRSAMSNELCKMREEGILDFDRNHFRLTKGAGI